MSKQKYYSRNANKLAMTRENPKTYWSLIKLFLNNRKIPIIPTLFHENKFVTDFKEMAELFNVFFAKQCSLIDNNSSLPNQLIHQLKNVSAQLGFQKIVSQKSYKT